MPYGRLENPPPATDDLSQLNLLVISASSSAAATVVLPKRLNVDRQLAVAQCSDAPGAIPF
jgi:hypothetical protein